MFEGSAHNSSHSAYEDVESSSSITADYGVILVAPTFNSIIRQKYSICLSASIVMVSITAYWIHSWPASMVILGSCFGGACLVRAAFSSSFQHFLRSSNKPHKISKDENLKNTAISCGICLTPNCERHVDIGCSQPFNYMWHQVKVSHNLDEAVEEFLNLALEKYIMSWHRELSDVESFIYELKFVIRWALSNLLKRADKVYLPSFILQKILPTAMFHVDCCLQANLKRDERGGSEGAIFDYYGADLHIATFNRDCELSYLRGLTKKILPYLVPPGFLESGSMTYLCQEVLSGPILMSTMDTIADPDIINNFLLVIFDKTPMTRYPVDTDPKVIFLENFAPWTNSCIASKLSESISYSQAQRDYLYSLMKYMRRERTVSILQFCLAIDEFSTRLLNPELNDNALKKLHNEAKNLYEMYMAPTGSDRLNFEESVIEEFRSIVEGPYEDITKLQSTEPLYQAHEYAFKLLENHLPAFCESFEYFEQLCGSKGRSQDNRGSRKRESKYVSAAARIGSKINKIRGALMPASAIDGSIEEDQSDLTDACFEADELKLSLDLDVNGEIDDDLNVRDLSAWRVSIPRVETKKDERNKQYYVFIIEVHRIDIRNKGDRDEFSWTVERQLEEFYVLETKLTEFHGDSVENHLPANRSFGRKGHDYMESKRPALEEFLQRLLQKPVFRGSELLFMFLSSAGDFTKSLLPDINLGRMIKNVPMKLLKERGQHLESFLQGFISSTENAKVKSNKNEFKDPSIQSTVVARKLRKSAFGDNAGWRLDISPPSSVRLKSVLTLKGLSSAILYLAVKVLKMHGWSLSLLIALMKALSIPFENFADNFLNQQLGQALVPKRIAIWIRLLKDAVLVKDSSKKSNSEKVARAKEALSSAKSFLPRLLVKFMGNERHDIGMETLFNFLQHPRLNKQLSYILLDLVILELFPELDSREIGTNLSETSKQVS